MHWDTNPLYALLHESIYCQGAASNWAAQTILDNEYADEFNAVKRAHAQLQVNFTGVPVCVCVCGEGWVCLCVCAWKGVERGGEGAGGEGGVW